MSDGKKVKLTNTESGDRGIHDVHGNLVNIAPGQSATVELSEVELKDAKANGIFRIGGSAAAADDDGDNGAGGDDGEPGPLDQSVAHLEDYLGGVTDPDEVQGLIDAETAGKSRRGALAALEARLAVLTEEA